MTRLPVTTQEPHLRVQQFIRYMQVIVIATMSGTAIEVALTLLGLGPQELWFVAAMVAALAVIAFAGMQLARSGRLNAGIFTWIVGSSFFSALLPLSCTGVLPLLFLAGIINVLLAGLFISPRMVSRVWPITCIASFVAIYLEYWWKGPRVDFVAVFPWLALVLNLLGIGLVLYLANLQGVTMLQAFESLQAHTQELEGNRTALLEQTNALRTTTGELVTRTGELEKVNLEMRTMSQRAQRRTELLQTSALVTHTVSQVRNLDDLLQRVTLLISQAFGYYHVGIFIVDELGRSAVLRSANSEGGQRMLARGYKVSLAANEADHPIASVIKTGQPRTAHYAAHDAAHHAPDGNDVMLWDKADLPDTRAEIILPLSIGERIFGALDAHSTQAADITEEDLAILGALADQIAIAIENAQLFARTQAALQEAQEAQSRYLRQEWEQLLPTLRSLSHEYRISGVPSVGEASLPEMLQALQAGNPITLEAALQTHDPAQPYLALGTTAALAVPIKLRDQVIGVIDLHETDHPRQWTDDDVALVSEVADQAAQALENVRLFEQTQRQAQREQLVATIATRLRAASDVEGVLRATVHEIRRALGASHGVVRLRMEDK